MAQLVKLQDYISRYEKDIYHYPSQYIRLKKENWENLLQTWEQQKEERQIEHMEEVQENNFYKWKRFFQRRENVESEAEESDSLLTIPHSKKELIQYFVDTLLPFQFKWASTTVSEMSFFDKAYYDDFTLKYFLQRFPDTYLLFYQPVFQLKNSPMEGDVILISPIGLEIIKIVEFNSTITLVPGVDRAWYKEENNVQTRILNPLLSIKRTEKIIRSILSKYDVDFPIEKVVLSRTNAIDFSSEPYHTKFVGKAQHEKWLQDKRLLVSPLKHKQLKVAELILRHCYTSSIHRPEWEDEIDLY
ncbi:NERD domain-containing protein [Aquibacillus koreensis]|uniref:NERD domain-containing protein n=1 Tax=Aquibacillus koreensis TaxID=279446 RepID=A0A9X4AH43_9BACI|nr:NERD domain-containing protein [Aquibacillus koreensis]MCT2535032.1 NERD domain-containing protein [Aquibacillus koreensis]MDC3419319.1 NERD domain-containing protein [Aquibacillus koreensis]